MRREALCSQRFVPMKKKLNKRSGSRRKICQERIIESLRDQGTNLLLVGNKFAKNILERMHKRPFLTPVENNIVAYIRYIAGYVCRKTREREKRNYDTSSKLSSQTAKWMAMLTYLMTLSLTRDGLSQVDCSTFTFFCSFCYLEVSLPGTFSY